ncbi:MULTISPECIES: LysR family transcriptional regulator [Pseudoalteromonas]|uniref:LysR family transcriptional regulator n=1 Tax=Pseudoalteromonas TaxID=53246 RepID=UPI000BBE24B4|nr:LysR family transcriptional regulator [Pseudoalteromonas sp. 1_2015MBL_MicDiv]ATG79509.1 LysR family transcriptional regulator [Pseudoalteromonas sp. 1_2015MBL_MicDiv]
MDKITAITSFVEVARCGSFTKSAEHLNLSRLQVTRHVQEIEQWLSLRLFHRTTRKVSLTIQGEEALIYCQQILSTVSDLKSRAHSHNNELVGTIRIASPIGLGQNLLFERVEQFLQLHPKTNVQLVLSDNLSQLVDERVDVALRYIEQPDDQHIARKLMHIDGVLCASANYLAESPPLIKPQDLLNHNCLVHSSATKWRIISATNDQKVAIKGNLQSNEMGILVKASIRGMGIANIPCDLANKHLKNGELVEVLPHYYSPGHSLWAVYLSRSYQQTLVRTFIDFLALHWQQDIIKSSSA